MRVYCAPPVRLRGPRLVRPRLSRSPRHRGARVGLGSNDDARARVGHVRLPSASVRHRGALEHPQG